MLRSAGRPFVQDYDLNKQSLSVMTFLFYSTVHQVVFDKASCCSFY